MISNAEDHSLVFPHNIGKGRCISRRHIRERRFDPDLAFWRQAVLSYIAIHTRPSRECSLLQNPAPRKQYSNFSGNDPASNGCTSCSRGSIRQPAAIQVHISGVPSCLRRRDGRKCSFSAFWLPLLHCLRRTPFSKW